MEPNLYRTRLHKFSCKPPGHDAARQRENQRRHRARVKGRIAELETSLLSAQSRLTDALKQIESLTAEVQRLQDTVGSRSTTPRQAAGQQQPVLEPAACPEPSGVVTPEPIPSADREPWSPSPQPQPLAKLRANSLDASNFEDPNDDCALLPPPSAGESTIPCREAYSIIKDRSSPEFDLSTATEWLKPGFRRALVPGTGCRVQTHILFAFVDHITST